MQKLVLICCLLFIKGHLLAQDSDSTAYLLMTDTITYISDPSSNFPQASTVGDVLKLTPSVFLRSSTMGGIQTVSAQGLNAQHIQVLWNDIPVNSSMLGVADLSLFSVGYHQKISYDVQNQELATGGLAGIVNIKDNTFFDKSIISALKQSVGSFGQSLTNLHHQGSQKNQSWSISATYEKAENDFSYNDYTVYPNIIKTQNDASFYKWNIQDQWSMIFKNGSKIKWIQEINTTNRNLPAFLVTPNNLSTQKDFSARQLLKWEIQKTSIEHAITGFYSHSNLLYEDYTLRRASDNNENLGFFRYQGSWKFSNKWKWSYGSDVKLNHVKTVNYIKSPKELGWDVFQSMQFQPNLNFNIKGLFKVATRSDLGWYFPFLLESNAFLGKNRNYKIWANIGADVRFPTLNDRFWMPGGRVELEPESNIKSTLGSSAKLNLNTQWSWNSRVEFFFNKIDDMILWYPSNKGFFQPINEGKVLAYGANLEQELEWKNQNHQVTLNGALGWNRSGNIDKKSANDKSQWVQLPYFPILSGKFSLDYKWKNLGLNIDGQSYSQRFVTRDAGIFLTAYSIVNTSINYTQKIKSIAIEGRISCLNLLNQQYEEVRYRPMPGRNYLFTLFITWKHEKN
ncbi:MAG TPA: TonB-dependent receptor plug domain-containing protein [Chitinophagales bacterium]|nr:TonB-dependent receptor plug domain-containing protein [Chitinophagales bacterium]